MDLSIYLRYYSAAGIYFSFRWGPFVHSLEIVQWDSTRRDHPGNLGGVSGSGPVNIYIYIYIYIVKIGNHINLEKSILTKTISTHE